MPAAVDFHGQDHVFRVRRVIEDVDHVIVLLSPAQLDASAPTLRVELPRADAPQTGSEIHLSLRPEKLWTF